MNKMIDNGLSYGPKGLIKCLKYYWVLFLLIVGKPGVSCISSSLMRQFPSTKVQKLILLQGMQTH